MAQVTVGETKVIRITNNRNGLFRELDFYKFNTDDVLKMIDFYNHSFYNHSFYNHRVINYSLDIYDKFTIKKRGNK